MKWTDKQEQVIETRDKSILVSAAAGSGKTTVLVERIFRRIIDPERPLDISSFLVVTFTRLAAAQMKEKLMKKIEEALQEEPENEHLAKQNLLVQNADITTIDSFCLNLVKENFHALSIDPSVNIGDAGMVGMLKREVLDQLFEEKYREAMTLHAGEPEGEKTVTSFERLVDMFCDTKSDDALKDLLDKIYTQVSSYPNPKQWIADAKAALDIESLGDLDKTPWIKRLMQIAKNKAESALPVVKNCIDICEMEGGPLRYREQIWSDREKLDAIVQAESYVDLKAALDTPWARLPGGKYQCSEELKDACKNLRDGYKKDMDAMKFLKADGEQILAELGVLKGYLVPLLELAEEFMTRFLEEKKARKMLEFSDISHMAYSLVCRGYDENRVAIPTELGKKIAGKYAEIYIDEYQDSNYLQEDILTAISGKYRGEENMFMVGDVKQSIYRFRMARPEIFVNKYNRFTQEGAEIKIELNDNFRSRDVVLKSINYFFCQLMGEDLGGISYDERHALVTGKDYDSLADAEGPVAEEVEFLLADREDVGDLTEEELQGYRNLDKDQLEGYMIASRIKELLDEENGLHIYDEDAKVYRKAHYKDIVILARSLSGYGETLYNALTAQGIPVYLERTRGYFNAVEIQVVMSLLSVVDNSRQDIPLAAVLLSPIGKITEAEMTILCSYRKNKRSEEGQRKKLEYLCLYEQLEYYLADADEDTELYQKVQRVFAILDELKEQKQQLSISELVWKALHITDYYSYALAMPDGEIRKANLDMLMEKAVQFENGYYKGLFHFLQYVEKLKLQEKDEGEASLLSVDANVVRIMSMHKSKGLEFPIVFVSGLGKKFNMRDNSDNVLIHPDYYLAAMEMHEKGRYKRSTILRDSYALLSREEILAENLRILYVAMTRAKEKLILTAGSTKLSGLMKKYAYLAGWEEVLLPYEIRFNASTYLDHILPCMVRYRRMTGDGEACHKIRMEIKNMEEIVKHLQEEAVLQCMDLSQIKQHARGTKPDAYYESVQKLFDYPYPYPDSVRLPGKISTSEIKKMKAFGGKGYDEEKEFGIAAPKKKPSEMKRQGEAENQGEAESQGKTEIKGEIEIKGETEIKGTTEIMGEAESRELTGAERGTLVHRYMELFPFRELAEPVDYDDVLAFVQKFKRKLMEDETFDEPEADAIPVDKIATMLCSKLGQRMIRAAKGDVLFREQQFSAGILASAVFEEKDGLSQEDLLIVQGIIDGFFYEDGEIVVLDYKTDACDEETLVGRYKAQIENYADVIEQLTGNPVKEKVFYSFHLGKAVAIPS